MSEIHECSICMDIIEENINCVTTECGHRFHTKCLMTNVVHNGFGCPYCRSLMAEEIARGRFVSRYESDDESSNEEYYEQLEEEEYALRGLRFFVNNINNEAHDQDDIEEETVYDNINENVDASINVVPKPEISVLTNKLTEEGVTMEQLVKIILLDHEEYEADEYEFIRISNDIFGRLRRIISTYRADLEETA